MQRIGSGTVVSPSLSQVARGSHLRRFCESSYFDRRFTWFSASPPAITARSSCTG